MAYQDSGSISAEHTLDATVSSSMYMNSGSINAEHTLDATISASVYINSGSISSEHTLDVTVSSSMHMNSGSISAEHTLDVTVSSSMYVNSGSISSEHTLDVVANFYKSTEPAAIEANHYLEFNDNGGIGTYTQMDSGSISSEMQLDMSANGHIPNVSEAISMDMSLDMSSTSGYLTLGSGPITMFNLLNMTIGNPVPYCNDDKINFEPQTIIIDTCKEESTVEIERYKNDTYPLEIVFSRDGNHSASGLTFTLYTQLDGDTLYTSTGTVMDSTNGIVIFSFVPAAIDAAGTGVYEIKVSGTDVATYAHGVFTIKDTLA